MAGDLSLSGTLLAWSGIGHAATPNTLGCMASPGLDCVGDRPISTHCGQWGNRFATTAHGLEAALPGPRPYIVMPG